MRDSICPVCGCPVCDGAKDYSDCLKPDEEIVCTNATVLVDKQGNISWIDNNQIVKWEE